MEKIIEHIKDWLYYKSLQVERRLIWNGLYPLAKIATSRDHFINEMTCAGSRYIGYIILSAGMLQQYNDENMFDYWSAKLHVMINELCLCKVGKSNKQNHRRNAVRYAMYESYELNTDRMYRSAVIEADSYDSYYCSYWGPNHGIIKNEQPVVSTKALEDSYYKILYYIEKLITEGRYFGIGDFRNQLKTIIL